MKKIVFSFVCMLMLGFSSCNEMGDSIDYYQDVPAIVGLSKTFQPTIKTSYGTFLAPELKDKLLTDLMEGDAIWTYFNVNVDQPDTSGVYTAYNLFYGKVETGWVQETDGGGSVTGDFDIPIENMLFAGLIEYAMFFVFEQTAPTDQRMIYELTYDSNETDELEVYIRAKKDHPEGSKAAETLQYPFAFNMYSFFMKHKDADNWVKFKIKYKIGVDDEGNDLYEYFNQGALIEVKVE